MPIVSQRTVLVSDKALAVGIVLIPAASALPLTEQPPRELDETDTRFVSRKALAAGNASEEPAASALPLTRVTDRTVAMIGELSLSGTALVAGSVQEPAASALPLTMIGELSQ